MRIIKKKRKKIISMSKIRFYKYYFSNIDKPVIMEAESRIDADAMLDTLGQKSNSNISLDQVIDVRIETPIVGISKRKRRGENYVWVGKDYSSDGWLLESEFNKINKNE